jgi:hypothetical protein
MASHVMDRSTWRYPIHLPILDSKYLPIPVLFVETFPSFRRGQLSWVIRVGFYKEQKLAKLKCDLAAGTVSVPARFTS